MEVDPSTDETGIVCDRFELKWELDGTDLLLAIDTDLPDEGGLSVSVSRRYYKVGSDEAYARDYLSKSEPVYRWRKPRWVALDADAWRADLKAHQDQMAGIGKFAAFEVARIEDNVKFHALLHGNQKDPRFGGFGNPNLSGEATTRRNNLVLVEAEASIDFPLDGPSFPSRSSRAPYDGLVAGESYRLSRETPLMPEIDPKDPFDAIRKALKLPEGAVVRVTNIKVQRNQPWYEVVLVEHKSVTGWINSLALVGQQIERVE